MKTYLHILPEGLLIVLILLAGYMPPFSIHPLALTVSAILVLQLFLKSKVLGFSIGILFFLGNLLFLGALLSEFSEFSEFNQRAKALLLGGLGLWVLNLVLSSSMVYKYGIR